MARMIDFILARRKKSKHIGLADLVKFTGLSRAQVWNIIEEMRADGAKITFGDGGYNVLKRGPFVRSRNLTRINLP